MFLPVMLQRDHLCLVSSLNVRWRAVVHVAFASGPGGCCGGQSPQGIKQLKANRGCRRLFQAHLTGRTVGRQEGACIRSIPMKRQERTIIRAVDGKNGACIRSIPRKRQERTWRATGGSRGCRWEKGGMHPQHPKEAPRTYMEGNRGQ